MKNINEDWEHIAQKEIVYLQEKEEEDWFWWKEWVKTQEGRIIISEQLKKEEINDDTEIH
jgi:hypothetical protein